MEKFDLYRDISERCGGSLYVGVVGPVRTGKSTFIKRFVETLVLPAIESEHERRRTLDTMPQSAEGRTVMTTEPKFIPAEPVEIRLGECERVRIKLVDCVGFVVQGAQGTEENGAPRMVRTPWQEEAMSFEAAAALGTEKVMDTHANVGFVITTDGSVAGLDRAAYLEAERTVIEKMKKSGKPFLILLNSANPDSESARALCDALNREYEHPVVLLNCLKLSEGDITELFSMLVQEFALRDISIRLPAWTAKLDYDNPLRRALTEALTARAKQMHTLREARGGLMLDDARVTESALDDIDYASGSVKAHLTLSEETYFTALSEACGQEIKNHDVLFDTLSRLCHSAKRYERIAQAMEQVEESGYGIVTPDICELRLEEPEIVEKGGAYGVKLRASAPSIHMIRADIQTEVSPTVGSERQSRDMVKFLLDEFEEDPQKIWESGLFGKSLHELVGEGLTTKLDHMPKDARDSLAAALTKIVNIGANGLLCILL